MQKLRIVGGRRLVGEVRASGAKTPRFRSLPRRF